MKIFLLFMLLLNLNQCTDLGSKSVKNIEAEKYMEISDIFSYQEFEDTKNFILNNGDRQLYSPIYNNNPHYLFGEFECYLNAEIGWLNSKNDPSISDFNILVIEELVGEFKRYYVQIVRNGDIENENIKVIEGMREGNVYLFNEFENDLGPIRKSLINYLVQIEKTVNRP